MDSKTKKLQEKLNEPFPQELVKTMKQSWGDVNYLDAPPIIRRLNEVFGFSGWNFTVKETAVGKTEVHAIGTLTVWAEDNVQVVREQAGECAITGGLSAGNALKGAITDSFKKCASMYGVGLEMWEDIPYQPAQEQGQAAEANPMMTKKQHEMLCNLSLEDDLPDEKKKVLMDYVENHESGDKTLTEVQAGKLIEKAKEFIAEVQKAKGGESKDDPFDHSDDLPGF